MTTNLIPRFNAISDILYPLYERTIKDWSSIERMVENDLQKARMDINVEVYLSRSMGIGMFAGILLWFITTLFGAMAILSGAFEVGQIFGFNFLDNSFVNFISKNKEWIFVIFGGIFSGLIGISLVFLPAIAWPKMQAATRKSEIEALLADNIAYMHALSIGGMNRLEIIKASAQAEETYGEVSKEYQSIINELEYFDTDFKTAIQNQIEATPSPQFAQFLTDMVAIIDSGGNMEDFLRTKQQKYIRLSESNQKKRLDTIELIGEMYMTLSVFPLLLVIILVIMKMMGNKVSHIMNMTVYGILPLVNIGILVVLSTIKKDKIGSGHLKNPKGAIPHTKTRVLNFPIISRYRNADNLILKKAWMREHMHNIATIIRNPHIFFIEHPWTLLLVTVPIAAITVGWGVVNGYAPLKLSEFQKSYYWATLIYLYVPFYIIVLPYAIFDTINKRRKSKITNNLSETLEKLRSVNETGQTLLESIKSVADSSEGKLSEELEIVYGKVSYDTKMKTAMIEFNNKYKIPRLSRIIKVIVDAQETSEDITDVLKTTAEMSRNQDDLEQEQKQRTLQQIVIILSVYFTLLAVILLLKVKFVSTMSGLSGFSGGSGGVSGLGMGSGGINSNRMSMMFFHSLTFQALGSSIVAGYMRDSTITSGLKIGLILLTISGISWFFVL